MIELMNDLEEQLKNDETEPENLCARTGQKVSKLYIFCTFFISKQALRFFGPFWSEIG